MEKKGGGTSVILPVRKITLKKIICYLQSNASTLTKKLRLSRNQNREREPWLAGWLVGHRPVYGKVTGSIPRRDTRLGFGFESPVGGVRETVDGWMFLPLSIPLSLRRKRKQTKRNGETLSLILLLYKTYEKEQVLWGRNAKILYCCLKPHQELRVPGKTTAWGFIREYGEILVMFSSLI